MTNDEKLCTVKQILGIEDKSEDELLKTYLSVAEREIITWRYSSMENLPIDGVSSEYEMTQVFAVIAGYSVSGAENQTSHNENGISRTFKYEDMIAYIRSHVIPYVKIP